MSRLRPITPAQKAVWDYLKVCHNMHFMASTRDITERFGWKSQSAAVHHLDALERKGYIYRMHKIARGIKLLKF